MIFKRYFLPTGAILLRLPRHSEGVCQVRLRDVEVDQDLRRSQLRHQATFQCRSWIREIPGTRGVLPSRGKVASLWIWWLVGMDIKQVLTDCQSRPVWKGLLSYVSIGNSLRIPICSSPILTSPSPSRKLSTRSSRTAQLMWGEPSTRFVS